MAKGLNTKRILIDQANSRVVIITSVAAFILVFCMVATKTLISQAAYQNRVISAKKVAVKQLKDDITATDTLKQSYQTFVSANTNILGGNSQGTGPQDGDNAQIVLDALPSAYDFPALATSLDKMLSGQGLTINSITGTDDEIAQSSNTTSATPQPVAMPFEVSVTGDYGTIQKLVGQFEHSIRPFQVQKINLFGTNSSLTLDVTAQTFYQPAKTLNIGKKVIK